LASAGLAEILIVIWDRECRPLQPLGHGVGDVLDHWLLRSPPTPIAARICWPRHSPQPWRGRGPAQAKGTAQGTRPLDIGIAAALVAFFIAANGQRRHSRSARSCRPRA